MASLVWRLLVWLFCCLIQVSTSIVEYSTVLYWRLDSLSVKTFSWLSEQIPLLTKSIRSVCRRNCGVLHGGLDTLSRLAWQRTKDHWRSLKRLHPRTNTNQIARSSTLVRRIVLVEVMLVHITLDHGRTSFVSNLFAYPLVDSLIFHAEEPVARNSQPSAIGSLCRERGFTTWY